MTTPFSRNGSSSSPNTTKHKSVQDLDQPKSAKDSFDRSRPKCDAEPTQYSRIDKPRLSDITQNGNKFEEGDTLYTTEGSRPYTVAVARTLNGRPSVKLRRRDGSLATGFVSENNFRKPKFQPDNRVRCLDGQCWGQEIYVVATVTFRGDTFVYDVNREEDQAGRPQRRNEDELRLSEDT